MKLRRLTRRGRGGGWLKVGLLALAVLSVGFPARSSKGASGKQAVTARGFFRGVFLLKAQSAYIFETLGLSANADTIMHVQNYPDGTFLGGNDDHDVGEGIIEKSSRVDIARSTADRRVYVIVRAKPGSPNGIADLVVNEFPLAGAAIQTIRPISFTSGGLIQPGSLKTATHITTAELPGGMNDSIVLVVSGTPEHAIGFDDNDWVESMSFLRLGAPCGAPNSTVLCDVIVGHPTTSRIDPCTPLSPVRPPPPDGRVQVVLDEDAAAIDFDPDGDFLSVTLENAIGTNPFQADTDKDGIGDGLELLGGWEPGPARSGAGNCSSLIKFPLYGANPLAHDVFVEADWLPSCKEGQPQGCADGTAPPSSTLPTGRDRFRLQAPTAQTMASRTFPTYSVHVDIGGSVDTSDTSAAIVSNNWGGTARLPESAAVFSLDANMKVNGAVGEICTGLSEVRRGLFHHFVASTAARAALAHFCALAAQDGISNVHELGHNFNLGHGGGGVDGRVDCKGNYLSGMNYAYGRDRAWIDGKYSSGSFVGVPLNSLAINEAFGLGNTASALLSTLQGNRILANANGVDWNMDGIIEPPGQLIKAPANWGYDCGAPMQRARWCNSNDCRSLRKPSFPVLTPAQARATSPNFVTTAGSSPDPFPAALAARGGSLG